MMLWKWKYNLSEESLIRLEIESSNICGTLTIWHFVKGESEINKSRFWNLQRIVWYNMSRGIWFPTMWHFDKCRLRRACAASFWAQKPKWCSVSSLTLIGYLSDWQRLWSVCTHAQADLRLCWLHIQVPHCWKSHVAAHIVFYQLPLISIVLLHADLINVGYLTAWAFIRSWWSCTFWMTSPQSLNWYKKRYLRHNR